MKRAILSAIILLAFILLPTAVFAQRTWDVTLAWDPNTEPDLKEYHLFENGQQVDTILAGTETVTRTLPAGSYTWYLTALDQSLNESGPSNSVGITLDEVPPTMDGITINISITVHSQ